MADLGQLGLREPETADYDKYEEPNTLLPPPPAGEYALRAPDTFSFKAGGQGQLIAAVDPLVVVGGGEGDGYNVRFTRISTKLFQRGKGFGSTVIDYLRANSIAAQPQTNQEYADLIEATAGRIIPRVYLNWEAYCKECDWTLKGMKKFPSDGNGGFIPKVPCGVCGESLHANAKVSNFRSALQT